MFKLFALLLLFTVNYCAGQEDYKIWAVLVAGSNDWFNYRHQADVCHAYQILHSHGVPDENIIVMMYDDIANNQQNPTPGIIINHPNGKDVYKNVPKDYVGEDVTAENFVKVLTGDEDGLRGVGSGRVLKSGPKDHVFINFVDHGAPGLLAFPTTELTVEELQKAIKKMNQQKKYGKLVFYIEACESGSMFKDKLPKNMNVFATTAANAVESSYACYYDDARSTYLGDWYSVNWMEDTDKEDISTETLNKQYLVVKQETNMSHVMEFGDLSIAKLPVSQFQGKQKAPAIEYEPIEDTTSAPSFEVPLDIMYRRLSASNDRDERKSLKSQITKMIAKRQYLETTYTKIVRKLAITDAQAQRWLKIRPENITQLQCHTELVHAFSSTCFNFGKNSYALKFAYILVNMCEDFVDVEQTTNVFKEVCQKNTIFSGIV